MMTRAPIDICVHCGEPEAAHHEFDPGDRPAGCVCDWSSWGNKRLPAICGAFVTDGREDNYCRTCHHDEACHEVKR